MPLPLGGLDERSSFGTSSETWADAFNVRVRDQQIRHAPNLLGVSLGGTGTATGRTVTQAFFSQPGVVDENRVVYLSSFDAHSYTSTGSLTHETGYALNNIVGTGTIFRPRFAYANSAHKFVWTCADATPPIRVRRFNNVDIFTVVPIAQDYSARFMIAYNKRIVIADTVEAGVRNTSRIRWCANGNFDDWTGLGAGFLEVGSNTSAGRITAFNLFDETAMISLHNEFIELLPTGSLFPVFELGTHHPDIGVAAPWSWQVWNHHAIFLGHDNVYVWDKRTFQPIGDPIQKALRFYTNPIARLTAIQSALAPSRGEYYLLMSGGPDDGSSDARLFIYDLKAGRWYQDSYAGMSSIGLVTHTYATKMFPNRANFDSLESIISTDNKDLLYIEQSFADGASVTQPALVTTQDFLALDSQDRPDLNAKNELIALTFRTHPNTDVTVSCSTNKGVSFLLGTTVTANSEGLATYHARVGFSHIRFTFAQVSGKSPLMLEGPLMIEWEPGGDVY